MKPSSLTTLAALVLIGAGSFFAGRISSSDDSTTDQTGPVETRSARSTGNSGGTGATSSSTRKARRTADPEREEFANSTERLARLESIVRGENPLDRNRALLAFIDQLGPDDFEDAVAHFRGLGITESRFGEYALLLSAWAKDDPTAALAYAKENTGNRFASNTILTTWASIDPEAAIRWAETNHEGDGANPYMEGVIRSLAGNDPFRATELLTSMPRSVERGNALDAILPHLLTQGNDATRAWISEITDDSLRNGAMLRVAKRLAVTDPADTATWLVANPGDATQRRMDDVYRTWANQDLDAAASSLTTLRDPENRSDALRGIVGSVAGKDPDAAIIMMNRHPDDVNDRVVEDFVWNSFGNDPSVAVNEISRMTDERQRNRMYGRTVSRWMRQDSVAANSWMESNPIPDNVREWIDRHQSRQ